MWRRVKSFRAVSSCVAHMAGIPSPESSFPTEYLKSEQSTLSENNSRITQGKRIWRVTLGIHCPQRLPGGYQVGAPCSGLPVAPIRSSGFRVKLFERECTDGQSWTHMRLPCRITANSCQPLRIASALVRLPCLACPKLDKRRHRSFVYDHASQIQGGSASQAAPPHGGRSPSLFFLI